MRIGELAALTGVTNKTIRYYEDIGLLPSPRRSANDYRDYDDDAVDRLRFVRDAQATGLTLTEIGWILDARGHGKTTCSHVVELLEAHLEELDRHIAELRHTRRQLAEITLRAQRLDPADCTDPNRCQTIAVSVEVRREGSRRRRHAHDAPQAHSHA